MSTNKGGLGLPHPRCVAIPTLVLGLKRCIEYTTQGVWVGNTSAPVPLPSSITSLFENWQSSPQRAFTIFGKFAPDMASICVHESIENNMTHFIHKSPPKSCRERLKDEASMRIVEFLQSSTKHYLTKKNSTKYYSQAPPNPS
jgi:hypothetical protein